MTKQFFVMNGQDKKGAGKKVVVKAKAFKGPKEGVDNSELINAVWKLKEHGVVKTNTDIADAVHYSRGMFTMFILNQSKATKPFLKLFWRKYNPVLREIEAERNRDKDDLKRVIDELREDRDKYVTAFEGATIEIKNLTEQNSGLGEEISKLKLELLELYRLLRERK